MNQEQTREAEQRIQQQADQATRDLKGPLPEQVAPEDKLERYRSEFGDRP